MKPDKTSLVLGVLMLAIGGGWLLTNLEVAPKIDWAWSLALFVIGLLAFLVSGLDKMSLVVGSLFLIAGVMSTARQLGWLSPNLETPLLVMLTGGLILLARMPVIPRPKWWDEPEA